MAIESLSVVTHYSVLNDILGKLHGAGMHSAGGLKGMFTRSRDFESSAKQLMLQLHAEHVLAVSFLGKGYGNDEFKNAAKKDGVNIFYCIDNSDYVSSFGTYDLSPALRHFLNDYCRVLEPLVKLLAQKHMNISAQNGRKPGELISFNSYFKALDRAKVTTPLNHEYFIKLYEELWNDYKHAESSGVDATDWLSSREAIISEPKLQASHLTYFSNTLVKDFIEKSLNNMSALLSYVD